MRRPFCLVGGSQLATATGSGAEAGTEQVAQFGSFRSFSSPNSVV